MIGSTHAASCAPVLCVRSCGGHSRLWRHRRGVFRHREISLLRVSDSVHHLRRAWARRDARFLRAMSLPGNGVTPYRFRFSRRAREQGGARDQARLWADVDADPRARMRCGSFFASDGAAVPYRLWTARKPQAAVLLLHGAFDYAAAFDEIGPKLARKGFAALAIDQRGFGATGSRGHWSGTARMAEDAGDAAEFLLARLGTDQPLFVIGESMGGAVAIHAAAAGAIQHLRGIVLVAPGALASRFRHRLLGWVA